jgi:uncharacterized protein YndB with AHSA1/START domain
MAMTSTRIIAAPGVPFVTFEREFAAPPELLFRAWTEPELLAQWMGPRRLTMRVDTWEVRDGGRWRYASVDTDGTEYGFRGVFHGTPSLDGITQTFEFEGAPGHVSLDRLTFEGHDGGTLVRGHTVHQSVEARDAMIEAGMEGGVEEGFGRLEELLERLASTVR